MPRLALLLGTVALIIAAPASWIAARATQSASPLAPKELASPATGNAAQPQLSVSSRGVLLSWIERSGDLASLKFAERTASGWTDVRTVASGRDWFVNWADVPSVMRLPNGTVVGHWLQKSGPDTYAYDVRLSYSKDDGKSWAPAFIPHHDGTKTEHGFASLFPLGDGLGAIWLDGRNMKPAAGHDDHGGGGAMTVHFGRFDGSWKQVEESVVDARVCECCPTAVTVTSEGVIAAFRDRSPDEIRDIYTARLINGKWSQPAAIHADGWKIAACPVNGPALSAVDRNVAAAWFTVKGEQGQAFVAFSSDAGRTYGTPIRIDDGGSLGRVDVALLPGGSGAIATWIEFADQRSQFRVRRIDRDGKRSAPVTIAGLASGRASGYPRMALAGRELVFAWTESGAGGAMLVKTAAAPLP
jgi:hypothetical protein